MNISAPIYSVTHYKKEGVLRLTWLPGTKNINDEDFRDALWVFADSATRHRSHRLIIDMREFFGRPSDKILAWRDEVIVPMYFEAGVKKIAWIWPGQTENMITTGEKGSYENQYFETEDKAIAWLIDR